MSDAELKTLGRYTIARVLGKGAMGVVYEGFDPRLNRRVAIKTILKSYLDDKTAKDYSLRFVREAQAVARLNHPNIVQVHDFGEEGDVAYLVMEFIRGRELKTYFDANERFDPKETVRIMVELCDALDFAHQAGIIHRDVKPGNVMLDSQTRTKLTDFGVARVQDVTRSRAAEGGTMVGTPAYMSPEQITGSPIDQRTDVFSAGIILYQFLTGDMPFTGGGAWTIAKKIMQDEPALPSSINTSVSPLFDAVVSKALAKDPARRYQSARALGIALKRALEGKPEEDDADKTVVRIAPPAPRPVALAGKAFMPGAGLAVVIAAVIATVGGSIWFVINQGTTPPPAAKVAETLLRTPPVVVQPAKPNASEQKAAERAAAEQKAAKRATARKEAAERAASEKAAAAKLAEEKAAAERAAAIEQERRAPFRPFEGKWKTQSGSVLEIKEVGRRLLGFAISPSAASAERGYRAGETLLEADLVAPRTLRGIVFLRWPREYRQCANVEVARYAMTASLSDNSNALNVLINVVDIDTCKIGPREHKETWTRTN